MSLTSFLSIKANMERCKTEVFIAFCITDGASIDSKQQILSRGRFWTITPSFITISNILLALSDAGW